MAGTDATPTAVTHNAQVYDLHEIKEFGADKLVRKKLFKTRQLWSEIACYEPGQATVMHKHPLEEEMIFVLQGTANMNIDGEELVLTAGSVVKFPADVMHDVRNLQSDRLVIMFTKSPAKIERKQA
ncbi:MAG: cupin domain-containing protein [Gammaproteobacteria bacterium]|nr:cupin domain-containing protein [Gammaproteobacteria bacterium]